MMGEKKRRYWAPNTNIPFSPTVLPFPLSLVSSTAPARCTACTNPPLFQLRVANTGTLISKGSSSTRKNALSRMKNVVLKAIELLCYTSSLRALQTIDTSGKSSRKTLRTVLAAFADHLGGQWLRTDPAYVILSLSALQCPPIRPRPYPHLSASVRIICGPHCPHIHSRGDQNNEIRFEATRIK